MYVIIIICDVHDFYYYYYYYYYYYLGDVHFFRRTVKRCTSGGVHVPSIYTHAM